MAPPATPISTRYWPEPERRAASIRVRCEVSLDQSPGGHGAGPRLMLEGGGGANGALLRAGLVDELSLVICPVVDGGSGAPSVFDSGKTDPGPAPIERMSLTGHEVLDGGVVWLRYRLG